MAKQRFEIQGEIESYIDPNYVSPVYKVRRVPIDRVVSNDYNPNSVAPPEMELLELSMWEDGVTQPIVVYYDDDRDLFVVVDGFHRITILKNSKRIREREKGFAPIVLINKELGERMASTIRHNRARGKHKVESMSDIVVELKRRNWSDEKIAKNLGMDQDEILRLCQITGLAEMFSDQEFSKSWDVEGEITESDFVELTDDVETYGDDVDGFRTVNTSDENRFFHTYEKWECYKAGFYNTTKDGMTKEQCHEAYRSFLSDPVKFANALKKIIREWKHSCEHYLTNTAMNRIAWLGQAAACYAMGIPSEFRSGFFLLTPEEQEAANQVALKYLNLWLSMYDREPVTMEVAYSGSRQADIY